MYYYEWTHGHNFTSKTMTYFFPRLYLHMSTTITQKHTHDRSASTLEKVQLPSLESSAKNLARPWKTFSGTEFFPRRDFSTPSPTPVATDRATTHPCMINEPNKCGISIKSIFGYRACAVRYSQAGLLPAKLKFIGSFGCSKFTFGTLCMF